jgi:hypothetical protein
MAILNERYYDLANAIVEQAAHDYERALIYNKTWNIEECERFFLSEWCGMLTTLDGEMLMQCIRERVRNRGKCKSRNYGKRNVATRKGMRCRT